MKKSEELKEEMKNLTDTFAIRSMKQRIALAESKEANTITDLVAESMAVVISFDEAINTFAEELMAIDHDEKAERVKDIHKFMHDLVDSKNHMLRIISLIKNGKI